ncbi:MAG: FecR domain-containing protein [Verrucomicrobia bacterium]|nr:FecR domain-containing protein [Verrucomicrobiota bacterium]
MSTEREDTDMIEEVAADWLAQREEGFSSAQAREFERWCWQDPRHATAVARLEQACALLEKMPLVRAELQPVVEFPAAARAGARLAKEVWRIPWGQVVAGLAAVLTLVALGWWQWPQPTPEGTRYMTSAGGYERVTLSDGSMVELNASTIVMVDYVPGERRVALVAGEAHFTVTHDPARPFIVSAGGVSVRAVGTAFNVRLASAEVEVLVTEGKVQVAEVERVDPNALSGASEPDQARWGQRAPPALLSANERLLIPTISVKATSVAVAPPTIEQVAPEAIREALAWQERKLVFAETPLRDVVAQFNRRNRLQLVVGDVALAERPVGGTFAADNVEGFVRLLESSGAIAVERRSEFEIVLRQIR